MMTQAATQPNRDAASGGLASRLRELGLTHLCLERDGTVTVIGPIRWIERVLVDSALFQRCIEQQWPTLHEQSGTLHEAWPGVNLVTLPRLKLRHGPQAPSFISAVLLLGPELITSEQLRLVCDASRLDFAATVARLDPGQFISPGEAKRLPLVLDWMLNDSQLLGQRVGDLATLSRELTSSYEELSLLYKLSASMTVDQPSIKFFSEACAELREVVNLKWMALQLADAEPRLENLAGQVFTAGPIDGSSGAFRHVGRQLIDLARQQPRSEPIIIDDTGTLDIPDAPHFSRNLLVIPLRTEQQVLGVLFGGDKIGSDQITTVDSKLCNSLAASLTIFLENKMLYSDVQSMFMGTLHALTSAIDAKDSYTRGHSERVALLSRKLAEAAGLDDQTVDRVYISGLVHDVGKIGVPESVLCKPGKLTDPEFEQIKRHPQIGALILKDIRQMQDLLPGVLHHHERWDGRGYPAKLAGEGVPLFGRLICLADSFDAMSSDRMYRRALRHEAVLDEVRRCAGSQFDPRLARIFVKLDFEPYFKLIGKHEHREAADKDAA